MTRLLSLMIRFNAETLFCSFLLLPANVQLSKLPAETLFCSALLLPANIQFSKLLISVLLLPANIKLNKLLMFSPAAASHYPVEQAANVQSYCCQRISS
jgi:hypothetical protein